MRQGTFLLIAFAFFGCAQLRFNAPPNDAALKASIVSALQAQRGLDIAQVNVNVNSGIVIVSGLVDSLREEKLLKKIIYQIPGVNEPAFNLAIKE
jgi:osmotically-inducible protein OsmY